VQKLLAGKFDTDRSVSDVARECAYRVFTITRARPFGSPIEMNADLRPYSLKRLSTVSSSMSSRRRQRTVSLQRRRQRAHR
jgi:hypothetical protein